MALLRFLELQSWEIGLAAIADVLELMAHWQQDSYNEEPKQQPACCYWWPAARPAVKTRPILID